MKILFLSRWFPYPINNGSKLRIYNLLRGLAQEHEITLLSFADRADVDADAPALRSLCCEMHAGFGAIRERMPLNCQRSFG